MKQEPGMTDSQQRGSSPVCGYTASLASMFPGTRRACRDCSELLLQAVKLIASTHTLPTFEIL